LGAWGNIVTKDEEKAEVLIAFFASVIVRPVFNTVTPVVLQIPSPLSWKTGTGSRMKPR